MNFKNYLIETHLAERILHENHELVLQKMIDSLDYSHVDYDTSKIMFDMGSVTGTPKLSGLKVVIRPSSQDAIRLGRNGEGNYTIVVDTTSDMPNRADIDTFLSGKEVYAGFAKVYQQYVSKHFDGSKEYDQTPTEKSLEINSREGFEDGYENLIASLRNTTKQYQDATKELDNKIKSMGNIGKKASLELAKGKLRDDYFGKSEKEFLSKVYGMDDANFVNMLSPEWKQKLESRLTQYYGSLSDKE